MVDESGTDAEPTRLRLLQEREVAVEHALTDAEFALAREAFAMGRTFEEAGILFDPVTFVVMRILESTVEECVDPIDCLRVLDDRGVLERSVVLALDLLDAA